MPDTMLWTESGWGLVDVITGIKHRALKWMIENIPCGKRDWGEWVL